MTDDLRQHALAVCLAISSSKNTRDAYQAAVRHWLDFCKTSHIDGRDPPYEAVVAWLATMRAPQTRSQRRWALSSVYKRLRRDRHVEFNPFSRDEGPDSEPPTTLTPTPLVVPDAVCKVVATCNGSFAGIRDMAIIRIFWATGIRPSSLSSMTRQCLERHGDDYFATVTSKGDKRLPVLIRGYAATALSMWLEESSRFTSDRLWCSRSGGPFTTPGIRRMIKNRAKRAGVGRLTPLSFRVAFATYNKAPLDIKRAAMGHQSSVTTLLYDRNSERQEDVFTCMPDPEDLT